MAIEPAIGGLERTRSKSSTPRPRGRGGRRTATASPEPRRVERRERAAGANGAAADSPAEVAELPKPAIAATPEQEALWVAFRSDPSDARRNGLVEAYQHLARHVVARFATRLPRSVDRGDLVTAANVGLIRAVTSFDAARGVRFEAYGERRIQGALLDELRTQDWLPRPWRHRIERHKRTIERLRRELDRDPRDDEVATALDLPLGDYQLLFGTGLPGSPAGSMPTQSGGDDGATGLDVLPDTRGDAPEDRLGREELLSLVAQRLSEQEYRIVYLKYWEELSMREIGELTGLSESRVCKIHARLIERLQERLGSHARGE